MMVASIFSLSWLRSPVVQLAGLRDISAGHVWLRYRVMGNLNANASRSLI